MLKKIVSILLAVVLLLSVATVGVSAAEVDNSTGTGNLIYFDATGWRNFTMVYCHIWERGGDAFFSWQSRQEMCTKVNDNIYSFDLSILNESKQLEGGIKNDVDYIVIFSANTGVQTFDTTFGKACIGDTAKLTGNMIENAVDSEKSAFEVVWTINSKNYGPHLALTSIGNIVGKNLCPNEDGYKVIGDWLCFYYNSSKVNATAVVVKALPKFNVSDTNKVYNYIASNGLLSSNDLIRIKEILNKAETETYGTLELKATSTALYIGDTYKIKATANGGKGIITYTSNKKSIAKVSSKGVVTAKKEGTAKITMKYRNTSKTFIVNVRKPYISIAKKRTLPVPANVSIPFIRAPSSGNVTWKSSNKKVATVSSKGKVKAVSAGKVTITATLKYKGKSYKSKCILTVKKIRTIEELIELLYNE